MNRKTFLIVGGSSGIGLELVKKLTAQSHEVFVISRTKGNLQGIDVSGHLTKDVTLDAITESELPPVLHGLAYCPGSINLKPFRSLKAEEFMKDMQVNLFGAIKVLQIACKSLKNAGKASVVLFSTVAVQRGMPFHASVASAKGAVEGLVRSLAAEWAPEIRVNGIAPSLTDTPLASRLLASDERRAAAANRHPLKRVGHPEEVATLAEFLLGDQSAWMTGQIIGIDGGLGTLRTDH